MVDVPESIADVQRRYVPSPVYLVDRFDRIPEAQGWQRRHAIDACRSPAVARTNPAGLADSGCPPLLGHQPHFAA